VKKYTEFNGAIMDRSEAGGTVFPIDQLSALAEELGVSKTKFDACLSEKETE
jgi:hypothetical protein